MPHYFRHDNALPRRSPVTCHPSPSVPIHPPTENPRHRPRQPTSPGLFAEDDGNPVTERQSLPPSAEPPDRPGLTLARSPPAKLHGIVRGSRLGDSFGFIGSMWVSAGLFAPIRAGLLGGSRRAYL